MLLLTSSCPIPPPSFFSPLTLNHAPCRRLSHLTSLSAVPQQRSSNSDNNSKGPPMVPVPPDLQGKAPRKFWNAASLAFLGDGVWELYVRRRFFHPPSRVSDYYAVVVRHVRAESQSDAYKVLDSGEFLTAEERDVLRWGRNATGTSPKRLSQGALSRETYREATAVECLTGYLYLTDMARLHAVMVHLGMEEQAAGTRGKP